MSECKNCGQAIIFDGYLWTADDDPLCPNGKTQHKPAS